MSETTIIKELIGKTLTNIKNDYDTLTMTTTDGSKIHFHHEQDCCESVEIEEIIGDLNNLIGAPIIMAEEVIHNDETPEGLEEPYDSYTWTFYKFGTNKGYVTIRWLGQSNGYYSEAVSIAFYDKDGDLTHEKHPWD